MFIRLLCIILFIGIGTTPINGQQFASDCNPTETFRKNYEQDISRLAVRFMQKHQNLSDSIRIPHALKDTIAKAMAAVYNADQAVTDSLFNHFQLHTFPKPNLNTLKLGFDSSVFKALNLSKGDSAIGIPTIDAKLKKYSFQITSIDSSYTYPRIVLKSNTLLNLKPLCEKLSDHNATTYSAPRKFDGDGDDIQYTLNPNHQQLNFKIKWGDCFSGCIKERTYQFKVYEGCSLKYTSYGDEIPNEVHKRYSDTASSNHNNNNLFGPDRNDSFAIVRSRQITNNEFTIQVIKPVARTEISVLTSGGTVVERRVKRFNNIPSTESFDLTGHPGGIYFVILITPQKQQLLKVVKTGGQY